MHKKILLMSSAILVFASSLGFGLLLMDSHGYEEAPVIVDRIENNYLFYIKGDNVIKLSLKEEFNSCTTGDVTKRCGLIKDRVVSAIELKSNTELVNYENKDITFVVNDIISNTSKSSIEVKTNWNNRYSNEELKGIFDVKDKEMVIDFEKEIDESELLDTFYKVSIDAKNGSSVLEFEVKKDSKVKKPKNPTRKGYTFVEWQVKGKKYNFDKPVKKDLVITAKWKKKTSKNN